MTTCNTAVRLISAFLVVLASYDTDFAIRILCGISTFNRAPHFVAFFSEVSGVSCVSVSAPHSITGAPTWVRMSVLEKF